MQKPVVFFGLAICLAFLVSCKKKDSSSSSGSNLGNYSFTQSELAILPYPTHDTLVFKSTSGELRAFYYRGRNSKTTTYYEHPDNPEPYKGNYYTCEENSSGFVSSNGDVIFFNLHFSNPYKESSGVKYFSLGVSPTYLGSCCYSALFRFDANSIISYLPDSAFKSGGYVKSFNSLFSVGPRLFSDVYELVGPGFTYYCPVYVSVVYYSIAGGFLGYAENTGKTWFLLPEKITPPSGAVTPRPYLPVYPASYWVYKKGNTTINSRTGNGYENFSGLTLTLLDGQAVNGYEGYVTYGSYNLGWVPLLSETPGDSWEMPLGNPSTNPNTRVTRVMQKTVNANQDSIIIQRSFEYHKDPLYTNPYYTWQIFKKNVGLVFECMVDTTANDTIYRKTLIDHYINH